MILLIFYLLSNFPHSVHFENDIGCTICHERAIKSGKSADLLLPEESLCQDCHEESMGYKRLKPTSLWIAKFSHNLHSSVICNKCHGDPHNPVFPQMVTCSECHDGVKAPRECHTCHEADETRLTEYHPPRWNILHAEVARIEEKNCFLCHEESQALLNPLPTQACENCHIRENLTLHRHPENFIFQHPQAFASREENCIDCHREFVDCRTCHREEGLYPLDHNLADWLTSDGGEHGEEAEANPEKCLSCHGGSEPICAQCHGGR